MTESVLWPRALRGLENLMTQSALWPREKPVRTRLAFLLSALCPETPRASGRLMTLSALWLKASRDLERLVA